MIVLCRWLVVVSVFLVGVAHASFPVPSGEWRYQFTGTSPELNPAGVECQHALPVEQANVGSAYTVSLIGPWAATSGTAPYQGCQFSYLRKSDGHVDAPVNRMFSASGFFSGQCPSGSTQANGQCTCNAPLVEQNGQCVEPCPANTSTDMTVRMGWARATARSDGARWKTSDGRGYMAAVPGHDAFNNNNGIPPGVTCDGQCAIVSDGAPGDWWYSTEPNAQGMHGVFREQRYSRTGATCTAKDPVFDSTVTPPPCDGYVGQVNGKTTCVAKEPPKTQGWQPKPTTSGAGAGKPSADPSKPPQGPNGETPGAPSDKAGQPDLGGTGTSKGDGVAGGGGEPPKTSTGKTTTTNPDGTTTVTNIEIEIEACGVPGRPACKIDESGTPTGEGFGKTEQGKLGEEFGKLDAALGTITSSAGKDTSWAMPGWFSHRACQPWNLGTFPVINQTISFSVCAVQPYVIGVTTFLWIVGTFLACLGMVENVMFGRSSVR